MRKGTFNLQDEEAGVVSWELMAPGFITHIISFSKQGLRTARRSFWKQAQLPGEGACAEGAPHLRGCLQQGHCHPNLHLVPALQLLGPVLGRVQPPVYKSPVWVSNPVQFMGFQFRLLVHVPRELSKSLSWTVRCQRRCPVLPHPGQPGAFFMGGEGKGNLIGTYFPT